MSQWGFWSTFIIPLLPCMSVYSDLCFPDDDEKAKRDAGKWWKPWVSRPGGEQQHHTTLIMAQFSHTEELNKAALDHMPCSKAQQKV